MSERGIVKDRLRKEFEKRLHVLEGLELNGKNMVKTMNVFLLLRVEIIFYTTRAKKITSCARVLYAIFLQKRKKGKLALMLNALFFNK